jgi:hypothetical protein
LVVSNWTEQEMWLFVLLAAPAPILILALIARGYSLKLWRHHKNDPDRNERADS